MLFRKMSIAGYAWLHDLDIQRESQHSKIFLKHKKRKEKNALTHPSRSKSVGNMNDPRAPKRSRTDPWSHTYTQNDTGSISRGLHRNGTWRSTAVPSKPQQLQTTMELIHYIQTHPHTIFARRARQFLLGIALCHTCIPEFNEEEQDYEFRAASPDELALVDAAKELGYIVVDRQVGTVTLKTHPNGMESEPVTEVYTILDVIEFSSARKRMSIILKYPDGRICLFCKGADSVITERLRLSELALNKAKEVQTAVNARRSMEAERAMQSRISISASRHSMSLARPSISGSRYEAVRDLDDWLRKRQEDHFVGDADSIDVNAGYDARHSLAFGEFRSPLERTVDPENFIDDRIAENDAVVFERTFQHIQDFATEGLRTLLYGHRFMTEQEYLYWRKIYNEATTSLENRQEKIEKAGDLIEIDLEISGATAIEDKLQDGVPDAIDKLRRANIKLWMLTGDKRETAVNIGHSCRLIKDYSKTIVLDYNDSELQQTMASARIALNVEKVAHSVVVIDGATLSIIEQDPTLYTLYLDLAVEVDSVICCRASPSQKASMVSAVRKKVKRSVTLAIGDGANDIAMIQEAHVGIGITGREGLQAARASDYSIAQFRFLLKLLLVHGRWFYIRIAKYVLATFYKEMLFYLTQAMYQGYCGYTGTSLHEQWSLSMFNTLFTSLPVLVIGIFDKDLSATTLLAVPELYTKGQKNAAFNFRLYFGWMFIAVVQALMCFFFPVYVFGLAESNVRVFALGNLVYTVCIMVICVKLEFVEMRNWTVITYVTSLITIFGWYRPFSDWTNCRFLWCIVLSLTYRDNLIYNVRGSFLRVFGRIPSYWFAIILAFVAAIIFDVAIISLRITFSPTDSDVFAELEKDPLIKARFEEEAASELQQSWNRGKGNADEEIRALLSQPRSLEDGDGMRKFWGSTTKIRTSDGDNEGTGPQGSGEVTGLDVLERRESLTHTGFDEELAQRFGAVIRKPFKRMPTTEAP
jgi:phospholipid-translocating ATPase